MNITATRFATKTRTWLLVAGLTALLIAIGAPSAAARSTSSSASPSR